MNIQELKEKLINIGIREDFYSLSGGLPSEAYCIGKTNLGWEVYYSERGNKNKLKIFNNENNACDYFYKRITSDSVVMENLNKKQQ